MKKTKIICSIGPVSRKYDVMKAMIENGMNVARINFSHADEIEKEETEVSTQIYDLNGKSVNEMSRKGFYIVNGKKVIVR